MEDPSNRTRLAKLLRFHSSSDDKKQVTLQEYLERMKDKQEAIYYIAGTSRQEVENSPFVERLLKKGYEVLYLTEPVDEYCIQALPEYEGKKFQNVAKEGLKLDEGTKSTEVLKQLEEQFKVLTDWLKDKGLKDLVTKCVMKFLLKFHLDRKGCYFSTINKISVCFGIFLFIYNKLSNL